jgi:hypothetical protein
MTTYSIIVTNKSWAPQSYMLFVQPPNISPPSQNTVYSNIYAVAPTTQNDGSVTEFSFTTDVFACCGTQVMGKNVIVTTNDNTPMSLAGGNSLDIANMVIDNGGPGFITSTSGSSAGSFEIAVPSYDEPKFRKCACFLRSVSMVFHHNSLT